VSEDVLNPDFEYWSFDTDYVEEEPRGLAAWTYEGDNDFEDDLRVRLSAEKDGFLFVPPYQFFASEPETYGELDTAYEEAVESVEDFDVGQIGDYSDNGEGE